MNDKQTAETWSIDTDTPLQAVLDSPDCPPLLHHSLIGPLSWQARNETSLRTTLKSPRVAPQWIAALLALGAAVTIEGEDGQPVQVTLEEVVQRRTRSQAMALHIPTKGLRWGEARVVRTPADEPIVAATAVVEMKNDIVQQARVALTGAGSEPARLAEPAALLAGGPLNADRIQAVAAAVEAAVEPTGDFMGSAEYRRAMAGVLTRRALEQCQSQEI
ncbi:MAG TPA: hypothetical protein ENN99_12420 [Chloroflexi bacterium]|nr:hypothetical protein [Chloroflexota bacterium]